MADSSYLGTSSTVVRSLLDIKRHPASRCTFATVPGSLPGQKVDSPLSVVHGTGRGDGSPSNLSSSPTPPPPDDLSSVASPLPSPSDLSSVASSSPPPSDLSSVSPC